MKDNAYRNSKLKKQLAERREKGCKYVIWSLTNEQKIFIEQFYHVEVWFYSIKTKPFKNVRKLAHILKTVHYKNKQGKRQFVCRLKPSELKMLDEYGVKYNPIKFKIYLIG